jgi:hypothetical protein
MSEHPDSGHDPDTCDGSCGLQHDWTPDMNTLDTEAVLSEMLAEPLSDELGTILALVHAFRSGDLKAALRLSMQLLRDREDGEAVWMLAQACQLLAQVCKEQEISPDQFRTWAVVASERPTGGRS